ERRTWWSGQEPDRPMSRVAVHGLTCELLLGDESHLHNFGGSWSSKTMGAVRQKYRIGASRWQIQPIAAVFAPQTGPIMRQLFRRAASRDLSQRHDSHRIGSR